ncbi:RagB/SusD family nutrient uptake outer membrane protein [Dyadobacter sediminis]|nr:RagB/SusD family nutrient uptake outer membrane protein [Dyadobacter sediminis]GGC05383.1 membrane protein [Dyadobacter sediminis]
MNKIPHLLLFIILPLVLSCGEGFLKLDPYMEVSSTSAIQTTKDLETALNGCYAQLRSPGLFGRNLPVIGDLAADNVYLSTRNSGKYQAFEQHTITSNNAEYRTIWFEAYTAILRANNVINSTLPVDFVISQLKGEAYALRALMYFTLVKTFARPYTYNPTMPGIPLVFQDNPTLRPPRNTIEQVYKAITADLDSASQMMTADQGSARFSRYAAIALHAKARFYMGDYTRALMLASQVIRQSGYKLLPYTSFIQYWSSPVSQTPGQRLETLFEVSADASLNASSNELGYMYQQTAYGDLLAGGSLTSLYGSGDIRRKLFILGKRESAENPAWIVNKYPTGHSDWDDKKILRLSELYLIAAEAAFRIGNEQEALTYLNLLISEREPSLQYTNSGQALLEAIITERRKELAFEGDRFHDLNRLNREIHRMDGQFKAIIPFSNSSRIGPIPEVEIIENENLVQNDGY